MLTVFVKVATITAAATAASATGVATTGVAVAHAKHFGAAFLHHHACIEHEESGDQI